VRRLRRLQADGRSQAGRRRGDTRLLLVAPRRRFYDIAKDGAAPLASETLQRIAALYAIEEKIRGRSAAARRDIRQAESKPLVAALRSWFEVQLGRVSGKSLIAAAFRYGLNHWDGLERYLEDGRIEMDTNAVERAMRPIALNRNYAQRPIMRSAA